MSDSRHVSVVCVLACDKRVRVPLSQQPSGCFVHRFVEMACSISNSSMLQQRRGSSYTKGNSLAGALARRHFDLGDLTARTLLHRMRAVTRTPEHLSTNSVPGSAHLSPYCTCMG